MTPAQANQVLRDEWKNVFVPLHPAVSYAFDNESFRGTTPAWCRVAIAGGISEQRSMGPVGKRRFEHKGTIAVQIFGELDKGRDPVDAIAASVRVVFQSKHMTAAGDPLWTKAAALASVVQVPGWFMATMSIPFSYFELA